MESIAHIIDTKRAVSVDGVSYILLHDLGDGLFIASKLGTMLPSPLFVLYAGTERRKQPREPVEYTEVIPDTPEYSF
jgi:hypothetical protein